MIKELLEGETARNIILESEESEEAIRKDYASYNLNTLYDCLDDMEDKWGRGNDDGMDAATQKVYEKRIKVLRNIIREKEKEGKNDQRTSRRKESQRHCTGK